MKTENFSFDFPCSFFIYQIKDGASVTTVENDLLIYLLKSIDLKTSFFEEEDQVFVNKQKMRKIFSKTRILSLLSVGKKEKNADILPKFNSYSQSIKNPVSVKMAGFKRDGLQKDLSLIQIAFLLDKNNIPFSLIPSSFLEKAKIEVPSCIVISKDSIKAFCKSIN